MTGVPYAFGQAIARPHHPIKDFFLTLERYSYIFPPETRVIGFGGVAQSGKTTAQRLTKALMPFSTVVNFADILKQEAKRLGWNGKKDEAGRRFLQQLGSAIRTYNPETFIRGVHEKAVEGWKVNRRSPLIVADVRYPNELKYIKATGPNSLAIYVTKPGSGLSGAAGKHESEVSVKPHDFDIVIHNDSDIPTLMLKLIKYYQTHFNWTPFDGELEYDT